MIFDTNFNLYSNTITIKNLFLENAVIEQR